MASARCFMACLPPLSTEGRKAIAAILPSFGPTGACVILCWCLRMLKSTDTAPKAGEKRATVCEDARWYVVRSQPHREVVAKQQLENQNYRVFLPQYFKSRRHARKFETVLAPLFPRYLFVILDLTKDRWRSVNGTFGVDRLLMRGGRPEAVPRGLIEQLVVMVQPDGAVRFSASLREGQTVRLTAGPFTQCIGELAHLDDHGRVRVLLSIMGGKVPVVVSERDVMPAAEIG